MLPYALLILAILLARVRSQCQCGTDASGLRMLQCDSTDISSDTEYTKCSAVQVAFLFKIFDPQLDSRDFRRLFPALQRMKVILSPPDCPSFCRNPSILAAQFILEDNCDCHPMRRVFLSSTVISSSSSSVISSSSSPSHSSVKVEVQSANSSPPSSIRSSSTSDSSSNSVLNDIAIFAGTIVSLVFVISVLVLVRGRMSRKYPRFARVLDALIICCLRRNIPGQGDRRAAQNAAAQALALQAAESGFRRELDEHGKTKKELLALRNEVRILRADLEEAHQREFEEHLNSLAVCPDSPPLETRVPLAQSTPLPEHGSALKAPAVASASEHEPATVPKLLAATSASEPAPASAPKLPPTDAIVKIKTDTDDAFQLSMITINRAMSKLMDEKTRIMAKSIILVHLMRRDFSFEQIFHCNDSWLLTKFRVHYASELTIDSPDNPSWNTMFSITKTELTQLSALRASVKK